MAIAWTPDQKDRVQSVLDVHPVASGRCEEAAAQIVQIARELDTASRSWRLTPKQGRYVVPRIRLEAPWYYHVTVEAEAHCVDALTGVEGTLRNIYAEAYWKYPDAIVWSKEPA